MGFYISNTTAGGLVDVYDVMEQNNLQKSINAKSTKYSKIYSFLILVKILIRLLIMQAIVYVGFNGPNTHNCSLTLQVLEVQ